MLLLGPRWLTHSAWHIHTVSLSKRGDISPRQFPITPAFKAPSETHLGNRSPPPITKELRNESREPLGKLDTGGDFLVRWNEWISDWLVHSGWSPIFEFCNEIVIIVAVLLLTIKYHQIHVLHSSWNFIYAIMHLVVMCPSKSTSSNLMFSVGQLLSIPQSMAGTRKILWAVGRFRAASAWDAVVWVMGDFQGRLSRAALRKMICWFLLFNTVDGSENSRRSPVEVMVVYLPLFTGV